MLHEIHPGRVIGVGQSMKGHREECERLLRGEGGFVLKALEDKMESSRWREGVGRDVIVSGGHMDVARRI